MQIFCNHRLNYAVISSPKAGCSTVANIFCRINQIEPTCDPRALTFFYPEYRYNPEHNNNMKFLQILRNPYHRFISAFIDKHVLKTDAIYLQRDEYKNYLFYLETNDLVDCLEVLADYLLKGNFLSHHFTSQLTEPLKRLNPNHKTFDSTFGKVDNIEYVCLEDVGFVTKLETFLIRYHIRLPKDVCKIHNNKSKYIFNYEEILVSSIYLKDQLTKLYYEDIYIYERSFARTNI